MAEIKRLKPIQCPGCKSTDKWCVAFGTEKQQRIIIDCQGLGGRCSYRLSLPTDDSKWEDNPMFRSMPLQYSNKTVQD